MKVFSLVYGILVVRDGSKVIGMVVGVRSWEMIFLVMIESRERKLE